MTLSELIFGRKESSKQIAKLLKEGSVRKLIPRVYTSEFEKSDEEIIRNNWQLIISQLFPEALLSHRTAIEYGISPENCLYLTHKSRRVLRWPGLTIRMIAGPRNLKDDNSIYEELKVSSLERACLENLASSRKVEGEKRTVEQAIIERRLIQILDTRGEAGLNKLRDRAKEISQEINMQKEFSKLDKIVSALLSTQPSSLLVSSAASAMSQGKPYDSDRMESFSKLIAYLKNCTLENRPNNPDADSIKHLAFIESYFSNYIEGTRFVVSEAEEIIFGRKQIPNRSADSHDIKGTFELCQDLEALKQLPQSPGIFIELLRHRHSIILEGRPEKNPGSFKSKANRAGNTFFVDPERVLGTLEHGFKLMVGLEDVFSRAIYMMFLISEVHPFDDGNGRIARIMMNAELVAGNCTKLIIPTVYRDDYLLNLKKFSRTKEPSGFVKMMDRAHSFTHWLKPKDLARLKKQLEESNAYKESDEDFTVLQFPLSSTSSFP